MFDITPKMSNCDNLNGDDFFAGSVAKHTVLSHSLSCNRRFKSNNLWLLATCIERSV